MQRSLRALLHRKALEKVIPGRSRFYKVSLSLVFVLWGFVFLISLWFIHGDGHRGNVGHLPQLVCDQVPKLRQLSVLTNAETNKARFLFIIIYCFLLLFYLKKQYNHKWHIDTMKFSSLCSHACSWFPFLLLQRLLG